jgi:hypothetical protein
MPIFLEQKKNNNAQNWSMDHCMLVGYHHLFFQALKLIGIWFSDGQTNISAQT